MLERIERRLRFTTRVNPATAKSQPFPVATAPVYAHHQNIQKALSISPEQVRTILEEEAKSYDKVQQELKAMKLLLTKEQMHKEIKRMAAQIADKFAGEKHLLLLTVEQGAGYFAVDLKRRLYNDHDLLFKEGAIRIGRYGNSFHGGKPKIKHMPSAEEIVGRKILIIEDLIEEGVTLQTIIDELINLGAQKEDIYLVAFTDKVNARKNGYENIQPHFSGYVMKNNEWVVGNGCDQSGYARPAEDLLYFPQEAQRQFGYGKPSL